MDVHDRIVRFRRTHQKTTALLHAIGCREPLYAAWVGHRCFCGIVALITPTLTLPHLRGREKTDRRRA